MENVEKAIGYKRAEWLFTQYGYEQVWKDSWNIPHYTIMIYTQQRLDQLK
jgi:hypothetical protein